MAHHHHHHHHHHGHVHGQQNAVSKQNEAAFDDMAASFRTVPWIINIGKQMTKELQENVGWIRVTNSVKKEGRLLDYACGSGVATRALAPYYDYLCGIDISAGMLKEFDRTAEEEGYDKKKMKAIRGDLLDPEGTPAPELADPEYFNFDTAVMATALHHVEDVDKMLLRLVERVRPGGTVLILDFVNLNVEVIATEMGVIHGGFKEDQMMKIMEKAGLENCDWKLFAEEIEMPADKGGAKTGFMARGVKPLAAQSSKEEL
ncbi:S-adenosyl-L-methionine-dependent methyltransferase [Sarocladium strictum]